jgi:hypothetical protein
MLWRHGIWCARGWRKWWRHHYEQACLLCCDVWLHAGAVIKTLPPGALSCSLLIRAGKLAS